MPTSHRSSGPDPAHLQTELSVHARRRRPWLSHAPAGRSNHLPSILEGMRADTAQPGRRLLGQTIRHLERSSLIPLWMIGRSKPGRGIQATRQQVHRQTYEPIVTKLRCRAKRLDGASFGGGREQHDHREARWSLRRQVAPQSKPCCPLCLCAFVVLLSIRRCRFVGPHGARHNSLTPVFRRRPSCSRSC